MESRYTYKNIVLLVITFTLLSACAAINQTERTDRADIEIENPDLPLIDYLRRIPGLQITMVGGETGVMVRGTSTFVGETSPLYVLNEVPLGNTFSQLESSVEVNDIATINVLRGPDAMQRYGMMASNGAIVVRTKLD